MNVDPDIAGPLCVIAAGGIISVLSWLFQGKESEHGQGR